MEAVEAESWNLELPDEVFLMADITIGTPTLKHVIHIAKKRPFSFLWRSRLDVPLVTRAFSLESATGTRSRKETNPRCIITDIFFSFTSCIVL